MELLGSDRMTTDVDFVCSDLPGHLQIRRSLSFGGAAATTSKGHPVDLVVRNDDYAGLYAEALEKAVEEPGLSVRVVLPKYLAAMKMAAGRDKDEADLKTLIRLETITFEGTADVVRRHLGVYALGELKSIFDEVTRTIASGAESWRVRLRSGRRAVTVLASTMMSISSPGE